MDQRLLGRVTRPLSLVLAHSHDSDTLFAELAEDERHSVRNPINFERPVSVADQDERAAGHQGNPARPRAAQPSIDLARGPRRIRLSARKELGQREQSRFPKRQLIQAIARRHIRITGGKIPRDGRIDQQILPRRFSPQEPDQARIVRREEDAKARTCDPVDSTQVRAIRHAPEMDVQRQRDGDSRSQADEASRRPSGLKARCMTAVSCRCPSSRALPVIKSTSRKKPRSSPKARYRPSGDKVSAVIPPLRPA